MAFLAFLAPILNPFLKLWKWLTDDAIRFAFALAALLTVFLFVSLLRIDSDRDEWRDRVREYENASAMAVEMDKQADTAAVKTAEQSKGEVNASNERARAAANASDDPLAAAFEQLRAEGANRSGKATR